MAITWHLFAGQLSLRLPLLTGVSFFSKTHHSWLDPVFQSGTYLLTAVMIWWERNRLAEFHIDRLAIALIICLKPLSAIFLFNQRSGSAYPLWFPLFIWITAIGLFIALWRSSLHLPRIRTANLKWFVTGAGAGLATSIILAYVTSLQANKSQRGNLQSPREFFLMMAFGFVFQLGYAAVSEEPLFRGFLWGCLRKAGLKEFWIWLFQAGLFMLGHIYYLKSFKLSFWIVVPAGALVYGFMAWRSRSIATSMAAHAAHNASGYLIAALVARL